MAPYEGSSASNPNTFGCFSHGEVALEARFERIYVIIKEMFVFKAKKCKLIIL